MIYRTLFLFCASSILFTNPVVAADKIYAKPACKNMENLGYFPPEILIRPEPQISDEAKSSEQPHNHTIVVGLCVDVIGYPYDLKIQSSNPTDRYNLVTLEAISAYRFKPAENCGEIIAVCEITVTQTIRLTDGKFETQSSDFE
jgi:hypothetical protein